MPRREGRDVSHLRIDKVIEDLDRVVERAWEERDRMEPAQWELLRRRSTC